MIHAIPTTMMHNLRSCSAMWVLLASAGAIGCEQAATRTEDAPPQSPLDPAGDYEWGPLHRAAITDDAVAAEKAIAAGADLNARGRYDLTPLHWAASSGSIGVTRVLLQNGVDVDAPSLYGTTALHEAANRAVAGALIAAGAAVEAKDRRGFTPLHLARTEAVAQALIDAGGRIEARARDGRKPVHMVTLHNNEGAPRIVARPGDMGVRMRGNEATTSVTLRNVSPQPITGVTLDVQPQHDAAEVTVTPPRIDTLHPGQRATFHGALRRNEEAAPAELSLDIVVRETTGAGSAALVTINSRINTLREIRPEDRGMIRLGQVQIRSAPPRYHLIAYVAAPIVLVILWLGAWIRGRSRRTNAPT